MHLLFCLVFDSLRDRNSRDTKPDRGRTLKIKRIVKEKKCFYKNPLTFSMSELIPKKKELQFLLFSLHIKKNLLVVKVLYTLTMGRNSVEAKVRIVGFRTPGRQSDRPQKSVGPTWVPVPTHTRCPFFSESIFIFSPQTEGEKKIICVFLFITTLAHLFLPRVFRSQSVRIMPSNRALTVMRL